MCVCLYVWLCGPVCLGLPVCAYVCMWHCVRACTCVCLCVCLCLFLCMKVPVWSWAGALRHTRLPQLVWSCLESPCGASTEVHARPSRYWVPSLVANVHVWVSFPTAMPVTLPQGSLMLPGECWPFVGSKGTLAVLLSHPIRITHVTLEHASLSNSPTGEIKSAPKDFEVYVSPDYFNSWPSWATCHLLHHSAFISLTLKPFLDQCGCWSGAFPAAFLIFNPSAAVTRICSNLALIYLQGIKSQPEEETFLENFMYDCHGEQSQTFTLQDPTEEVYDAVELHVLSNWGQEEYTCLYRFRVHGHIAPMSWFPFIQLSICL